MRARHAEFTFEALNIHVASQNSSSTRSTLADLLTSACSESTRQGEFHAVRDRHATAGESLFSGDKAAKVSKRHALVERYGQQAHDCWKMSCFGQICCCAFDEMEEEAPALLKRFGSSFAFSSIHSHQHNTHSHSLSKTSPSFKNPRSLATSRFLPPATSTKSTNQQWSATCSLPPPLS